MLFSPVRAKAECLADVCCQRYDVARVLRAADEAQRVLPFVDKELAHPRLPAPHCLERVYQVRARPRDRHVTLRSEVRDGQRFVRGSFEEEVPERRHRPAGEQLQLPQRRLTLTAELVVKLLEAGVGAQVIHGQARSLDRPAEQFGFNRDRLRHPI
jgi:hypothetical protein